MDRVVLEGWRLARREPEKGTDAAFEVLSNTMEVL
jgi:hypothetical protein